MKKKIICALLALATVVGLGACSSSLDGDSEGDSSVTDSISC